MTTAAVERCRDTMGHTDTGGVRRTLRGRFPRFPRRQVSRRSRRFGLCKYQRKRVSGNEGNSISFGQSKIRDPLLCNLSSDERCLLSLARLKKHSTDRESGVCCICLKEVCSSIRWITMVTQHVKAQALKHASLAHEMAGKPAMPTPPQWQRPFVQR